MLENMTASPYANYGYGYPTMQYAPIKRPAMTQPLSPEEMQLLQSKGGAFSTLVAKEDIFRSFCTHKKDGNIALVSNGDGTYTCPICQETFAETDLDPQHVKEVTTEMKNILQMIKTCYMDIPEETARQYFAIIPLLEKAPQLAEIAMRNFAQYEQGTMIQNGGSPYSFNAYNSLVGNPSYPGLNYNAGYQQPMYQAQPQPQYQQPMQGQPQYQQPMQPQPMVQPMMGQPMYQQPMQPQQVQVTPQYTQPGFAPVNEFGSYAGVMAQPVAQPQPQYQQQVMPAQQPQPVQGQAVPQQPTVDTSTFTL